jgi:hypothetical protein
MGHKYEVAIWTRKGYARGDYHYLIVHTGNGVFGLYWAIWKNRKNGAVRVILR